MEDIDFNKTEWEYFFNEAEKLKNKYRIKHTVTDAESKESGINAESEDYYYKPGDVVKRDQEWPEDKREAFELFREYHAKHHFLIICAGFLEQYGNDWKADIMADELKEIEQFIKSANKIDSRKVFSFSTIASKEIIYRRLSLNYFESKQHIQFGEPEAAPVYARYFLFRELLQNKLEITEKQKDEESEKQNNEELPEDHWKRYFKNEVHWQLFDEWRIKYIRNELADYSFIYRVMYNDEFIFDGIGQTEFKIWIEEKYTTSLGKQLKLLYHADTPNKYDLYASLINKYKLHSATLQKRSK